jgi:hypothetical protein
MTLNAAATAWAIARHGLKALKTSPKRTLRTTVPSQNVTKTNVTEKLRSGTSTPAIPVQTTRTSNSAPIVPAAMRAGRPTSARPIPSPSRRHR